MASRLEFLLKKRAEKVALIANTNDVVAKLRYIEQRLTIEREIDRRFNLQFEKV